MRRRHCLRHYQTQTYQEHRHALPLDTRSHPAAAIHCCLAQGRRQPCRLFHKATSSSRPPIAYASPSAHTSSFYLCPSLLVSCPSSYVVSPIAKVMISSFGKRRTPPDSPAYMLITEGPPVGRPSSGTYTRQRRNGAFTLRSTTLLP